MYPSTCLRLVGLRQSMWTAILCGVNGRWLCFQFLQQFFLTIMVRPVYVTLLFSAELQLLHPFIIVRAFREFVSFYTFWKAVTAALW